MSRNRMMNQNVRPLFNNYNTTVDGNFQTEVSPDSLLKALSDEPAFNTLWKKVERGCQEVLEEPFVQRNLMVYSQDLYRLASNKCTRVPMLTRGASEHIQARDDIAQQYLVLYYLLRDLFKGHLAKVAPKMAAAHQKTAKRFAFENASANKMTDAADSVGGTVPEDRLALIKEYCIQWGRFAESVRKIKAIFSYVHNHWHTLDINNHKTPFDAQTMACTLWGENAMDAEIKCALGESAIEIIHRDRLRCESTVDFDSTTFSVEPQLTRDMRIVQRCLSCLLELSVVHSRPLATYVDWFEKPLEEKVRTFFESEAKKHAHLLLDGSSKDYKCHVASSSNLIKYLRVVRGWLDMEEHRAELCMAETTKVSIRGIILTQFGFVPSRRTDDTNPAAAEKQRLNQILVGSVLRCARYARLNVNRTTCDIDCTRVDAESGERLFHRVDDTIANELLERHIKATTPNSSALTSAQIADMINNLPYDESNTIVMNEVDIDYDCLALYCRMLTFVDAAVASFATQFSTFVQEEAGNAIDNHVFGAGKDGVFAIQELLRDPSILTSAQLSIFIRYSTLIEQVFKGSISIITTSLEQAMSGILNKNTVIQAAASTSSGSTSAHTAEGRACEFLARYFHSLLCTVTADRKINTLSDAEFNIKARFSCTLLQHLQEPEHFRTHYQFLLMRRLLYSPSYAPCNIAREKLVIERIASARSSDFVHLFSLMIKEAPQTSGMVDRVSGGGIPHGMETDAAPQLACAASAEVVLSLLGQYGWPQSRELSEGNRDYGGGMPCLRPIQPANPNDPLAGNNPHRLFPQKDASAYPPSMVCPLEARLSNHSQINIKKLFHWSAPLSHGELSFPTRGGGSGTLVVSYTQMKILEALETADANPVKRNAGCTFAELLGRINGKAIGGASIATTSAQQTQEDENDIIKSLYPMLMEGVVEVVSTTSQIPFASDSLCRSEFASQSFKLNSQWPLPTLTHGSTVDVFSWYVLHPVSPASASAALCHFVTCPKEANQGLESELREKLMKMTMLGGRLQVPDSGLPQFLVDILPTKLIDGTRHIVGSAPGSGARGDGSRQVGKPGGCSAHRREALIRGVSLQATIMTLMKRNGTMNFNDIRDETSRHLTKEFTGFELEPRDFKVGLEKLIANGYIQRSPTNPAEFTFVA